MFSLLRLFDIKYVSAPAYPVQVQDEGGNYYGLFSSKHNLGACWRRACLLHAGRLRNG